jgi:hypothetical protein
MYQDLQQNFWWTRMKREIAKNVYECDTCQRVKSQLSKSIWYTSTTTHPVMEVGRH